MKISDLPNDEYITLFDKEGNRMECEILGKTVYDEDEYIICKTISGEFSIIAADVRILQGQQVPVVDEIAEEVCNNFFEEHPDLIPEEICVIEMVDEDGEILRLEYLDLIEEEGKTYFVGIDADDKLADEVFILEVIETENQEEYIPIEDEELVNHLFRVFKQRNPEL
jgi:hypothetical protein